MNGAEHLMRTATKAGVEVCFANPGTTELPLVVALDKVPGIRGVLGLFEGVCTGAADGYGRMADRPALTLLHLGPGLGNGIANLHNARRAHTPIVNLIGDHATWHARFDAPLTSDIHSLARPVSSWIHQVRSAKELADDFARALVAALAPPGHVATLIVPSDCQWEEGGGPVLSPAPEQAKPVDAAVVAAVADAVRRAGRTALLLGGRALRADALQEAARVASVVEGRIVCETFPARLERGVGLPAVERLPYFPEQAAQLLSEFSDLVLVGAGEPVSFFGYPGVPSRLAPESCTRHTLARPDEDGLSALEALADALGAPRAPNHPDSAASPPARPAGSLTPATLGAAVAAVQPEEAIVVDEAATSGFPYFLTAAGSLPHTFLCLTGGAIGMGLPVATGAAVACPRRPVIALQADGSAMYTVQALWTQAREGLDVTTVLCSNRSYRILQIELARSGVAEPGPTAQALTDLSRPPLDWLALARGHGIPAVRVDEAAALAHELERALAEPGPHLIEAVL